MRQSAFNSPLVICISALLFSAVFCSCGSNNAQQQTEQQVDHSEKKGIQVKEKLPIIPAAERIDAYLPLLKGKKAGLVVNQTSLVGEVHLVDTLLSLGIAVEKIFAPEHGFRGEADAGETVKNSRDTKTNLPIISLYGKNKKPFPDQLAGLDVVVFDIQDVGARFYTYISTMHYVMEACAENNLPVMVLDRPNPNGWYVDGPVLDTAQFKSFVGMHPIPVVHGLTVGELANMIIGESWTTAKPELTVISCANYSHSDRYSLPVRPSPNLPNDRSIFLYPSLCLFEGTPISVGRGTDLQFQVIGHPELKGYDFSFTPEPKPGAKYPPLQGKTCFGRNLAEGFKPESPFFLSLLIEFYQAYPKKEEFFSSFFRKLAGNDTIEKMISEGKTEAEIRESWKEKLADFKAKRKKYLLYPDFE